MSIASEYVKRAKTPVIHVTINRFEGDDPPSVEGVGTKYYPQVVDCEMTYGFDQGTASCTLTIKTPLDTGGNYVRFEPMDRVVIRQGWNNSASMRTTFFGFVDTVETSNPPRTTMLSCRDVLKLAQDNYFTYSNRKVYWAQVAEDEPDPNNPGSFLGGQSIEQR